MPHAVDTGLIVLLASILGAVLTFLVGVAWRRSSDLSRSGVFIAATAWLAMWSLEYWIFGSASFIRYYDEANYELPMFLYYAKYFDGGTFVHSVLTGSDHLAMQLRGGEYASFEQALIKIFPLWIANILHKLMVGAFGFAGTYILCRRTTSCRRLVAVILAAVYTMSHSYLYVTTYNHGIGYAAIPLAIYLLVIRADRQSYFPAVILFSALLAISTSPTHSLQAMLLGLAISTMMFPVQQNRRVLGGGSILLVAVLINWHEVLYAMASNG